MDEAAQRFGLDTRQVEAVLRTLVLDGRIVEGGFRPTGLHREWCDVEVLRQIRRKSLARLRKEIEPVEQHLLARFTTHWQGVLQQRRGLDALLDTVENLQGAPLPASLLESTILPARLTKYSPGDLDTLIAAGEVVWCGFDPLGEHDGRIGLYLSDKISGLLPPREPPRRNPPEVKRSSRLSTNSRAGARCFSRSCMMRSEAAIPARSSMRFGALSGAASSRMTRSTRSAPMLPSRRLSRPAKRQHNLPAFRSRRTTPPSAQGRWTLLAQPDRSTPAQQTEWSHALALQLLNRYGILTRETVAQENVPGGFSAVYDVLKALEESGRIRRGYFVAGLGAAQFALPAAVDMLRSLRANAQPEKAEMVPLAATDTANLYGSVLRWPQIADDSAEPGPRSLTRSVGASVILRSGELLAYMRRNNPNLQIFLPAEEPDRSNAARDLAAFLANTAQSAMREEEARSRGGLLIATINGQPVHEHWLARFLLDAGFLPAPMGFNIRRARSSLQFPRPLPRSSRCLKEIRFSARPARWNGACGIDRDRL